MAKTIENLFFILHYSTCALIILLYLVFFRKVKNEKGFLGLFLYSLADLSLNLFRSYISPVWSLYIWSTFTFLEYSVFTYIIWSNIKNRNVRKALLVLSIFFIVLTTIYNIFTHFGKIDSIPIGVETILILIYSFYFLYEQMNDTTNLFIYSRYQFWLIVGFMIYLAGSFFVYIFASGLANDMLTQYWFLTNGFYSLMNILIAVSFFIYTKKPGSLYPKGHYSYIN